MKKILIVEDELCLRFLYKKMIKEDIEIDEVTDGFEALELLGKKKYNLILLDINLPIINGLDILKKLRDMGKNRETAVIILSALGMKKYKDKAEEFGVKEYLEKPVDLKSLKMKIEKWCS